MHKQSRALWAALILIVPLGALLPPGATANGVPGRSYRSGTAHCQLLLLHQGQEGVLGRDCRVQGRR